MPQPPPLPRYVPPKPRPDQAGPGGGTPPSEGQKDASRSVESEKEKVSEEHQVVDPLLVKAIQAAGLTIGIGQGGRYLDERAEVPPDVIVRPGRKAPIDGPFLDPDGSVSSGEEEDSRPSSEEALELPSLLELYRERLIQKYNFTEEDPVFALAEILSEAERRALARNSATERACQGMVDQTQQMLSVVEGNVAKIEGGFSELEMLEQSVQGLQSAADSLERLVIQQQEDLQARLTALDLLQKDLTRDVNSALQRRVVDRLLVVLIVCLGIVIGSNLHWFFGR